MSALEKIDYCNNIYHGLLCKELFFTHIKELFMKNCIKIIVLISIILSTIAACNKQTQVQTNNQSQGTNPFLGTWIDSGSNNKIFFADKKWSLTLIIEKLEDNREGTYTFKNNNATLIYNYFADEFEYSATISGNTLNLKIDDESYNFIKQ